MHYEGEMEALPLDSWSGMKIYTDIKNKNRTASILFTKSHVILHQQYPQKVLEQKPSSPYHKGVHVPSLPNGSMSWYQLPCCLLGPTVLFQLLW